MPITNKEALKEYEDKNKDDYGGCCVKVAKKVMEALDKLEEPLVPGYYNAELEVQNTPHGLICEADDEGISGFMAGCVAKMVYDCHSRGEEFKKVWNSDYIEEKEYFARRRAELEDEKEEDKEGVINPAFLNAELKQE